MISGSFECIFHFSFLIYLDKSSNKKQKIHLKIPPKSEEIKFKQLLNFSALNIIYFSCIVLINRNKQRLLYKINRGLHISLLYFAIY